MVKCAVRNCVYGVIGGFEEHVSVYLGSLIGSHTTGVPHMKKPKGGTLQVNRGGISPGKSCYPDSPSCLLVSPGTRRPKVQAKLSELFASKDCKAQAFSRSA
jgi:hypothetical protein